MENNADDLGLGTITKQIEDMMKGANKALKDVSKGIKEVDKKFVKFGKLQAVARRMSNGIITIEFANEKDQKQYFDTLK